MAVREVHGAPLHVIFGVRVFTSQNRTVMSPLPVARCLRTRDEQSNMRTWRDSLYLLLLLDSLSNSVDWQLCGDDHEFNCRYCVEVSRDLSIPLFMQWKDIAEVNSRQILMFVATLKHFYKE